MPYIKKDERKAIDEVAEFALKRVHTPGQLNYLLSKILVLYLKLETPCYQTYLEVIGTLECVKLELYRRSAAPYEDKKKKENGDLF